MEVLVSSPQILFYWCDGSFTLSRFKELRFERMKNKVHIFWFCFRCRGKILSSNSTRSSNPKLKYTREDKRCTKTKIQNSIPFLATNPSNQAETTYCIPSATINFYVLHTKVRKYVLNPGDYHDKILRHALPNERWIKIRQAENKSATDKNN